LTDKVVNMKNLESQGFHMNGRLKISMVLIAVIITATMAFGHGGKHSDKFTRLQALQKATKLYDQLITKGKLDQGWEIGLQNVTISNRKHEGKSEIVVSFQREKGDPQAVYIFFNSNGKYIGSNFTGE
jgi:Family of unknown function (DUF6488)